MEMESLLIYSDGECAVVLVINADHSSLGKRRERGKKACSQTAGHVILLFPFLSSCPPHVPAATDWLSFTNYTWFVSAPHSLCFKSSISSCLIVSFSQSLCVSLSHIRVQPFGTWQKRREGRRRSRWDLGKRRRRKAGKGGEKIDTGDQQLAADWRERTAEKWRAG